MVWWRSLLVHFTFSHWSSATPWPSLCSNQFMLSSSNLYIIPSSWASSSAYFFAAVSKPDTLFSSSLGWGHRMHPSSNGWIHHSPSLLSDVNLVLFASCPWPLFFWGDRLGLFTVMGWLPGNMSWPLLSVLFFICFVRTITWGEELWIKYSSSSSTHSDLSLELISPISSCTTSQTSTRTLKRFKPMYIKSLSWHAVSSYTKKSYFHQ